MKTYVVGNLKGGVGKTTTTVNLAYSLSLLNQKVLVVDCDPQCNTTVFFSKVNAKGVTIKQIFENPEKIKTYKTKYANIDLVKGFPEVTVYSETALNEALAHVKDRYDICLIDSRPVFDDLTKNAVYAADVLLTPIKFDNFCRDNLALVEDAYHEFAEVNLNLEWYVFANMVARAKAQKIASEDLIARHAYPVLDTCISRSAVVDNALSLYKPVAKHRSDSIVASDFMELATELLALPNGGDSNE